MALKDPEMSSSNSQDNICKTQSRAIRNRKMVCGVQLLVAAALCLSSSGCRWTSTGQNTLGVRLFQQGRYSEALQQFQTALSSDPSNPDAYYNLGSTYHKVAMVQKDQRLVEQAESLYNQCLDLSPNHIDCHRGLAVLLSESGRPDSAMRC